MSEENRQHKRIKVNRKALIVQSNGEKVVAKACDVSVAGVGIVCEYSCDIGQTFELIVNLLGNPKQGVLHVKAQARFINLIGGIDAYRIGFQIIEFYGNSEKLLASYIQSRSNQPSWV
ncbi:MAG: PilZ domain-containing protein [Gammaproteobacteria bacterium]|mgnify:CR=1 FL=1|nr:MAG: PilZ domain-containing protein [Gammaproteobacteria bacterium]